MHLIKLCSRNRFLYCKVGINQFGSSKSSRKGTRPKKSSTWQSWINQYQESNIKNPRNYKMYSDSEASGNTNPQETDNNTNTTANNENTTGSATNEPANEIPQEQKVQHVLDSYDTASLFSLSRPQHAVDGLGKGLGNIVKGAVGGAAMIVTAPFISAVQGGNESGAYGAMRGFGIGLGMGLLGGTSLILGGCLTGVTQIGRGVYNTPLAMYAYSQEKEWDAEKKDWIIYNLKTEMDEVLNMSEEDYVNFIVSEYEKKNGVLVQAGPTIAAADGTTTSSSSSTPSTQVKKEKIVSDREFYEILGVRTDATQSDIKKAYYMKAKQSHPDRFPNDPTAHAKFQKIGEAYQVLSDEKLRSNYDQAGKDGVEGAPKMESGALFAMIFGSEKFDNYLGELQLATQMQAMSTADQNNGVNNYENHSKIKQFKQKKREVKCAVSLIEKLQSYVDSKGSNEEVFKENMRKEAKELSETPFGGTLVTTIGVCYNEYARQELDPIESIGLSFQQTGRNAYSRMTITSSGIQAALISNSMNNLRKKVENNQKNPIVSAKGNTDTENTTADQKSTDETKDNEKTAAEQLSLNGMNLEDQEQMKKYMTDISLKMFTVMWAVTELDIRNTLANVCKKVTHDHSVSQEERLLRCKAMQIMGSIFMECGGSVEAGMGDIMSRMTTANMQGFDEQKRQAEAKAEAEAVNDTESVHK